VPWSRTGDALQLKARNSFEEVHLALRATVDNLRLH